MAQNCCFFLGSSFSQQPQRTNPETNIHILQFFIGISYFQTHPSCFIAKIWPHFWFIELDDGKIYRKPLYLMVKTMVSCRFSLKPIHWLMLRHPIFPRLRTGRWAFEAIPQPLRRAGDASHYQTAGELIFKRWNVGRERWGIYIYIIWLVRRILGWWLVGIGTWVHKWRFDWESKVGRWEYSSRVGIYNGQPPIDDFPPGPCLTTRG